MTKLPTVSALINEVDNEHASASADDVHASASADDVHASASADAVRSGVEYIGNNVISTEAPTKFNDIFFFGVVKGR